MRNERFIGPAVLLLLAGAAQAQNYFQQAYGPLATTGVFRTSNAVRHANGTWTMCGGVDANTTLLHLNADGATAWTKHFSAPEITPFGYIGSTAAGAGNSTLVTFADLLEAIGPDMRRRYVGVARIAANGAILWAKRHHFDVPGSHEVPYDDHELAVDADGGFFVDGGETDLPSVMRFTSDGTLTWARALDHPEGVGQIRSLVADGTGGCYFLAGYSPEIGEIIKVIIGRFNSSGELVWNTTIKPAATDRVLDPLALLELADGNLLITAREYGGGVIGTSGVLLKVDNTGTLQNANEYWNDASETLYIYNTLERSDGQLWMDFQTAGYGFARLDAQGTVQEAERFTYQQMGGSLGVVAWEQTLMHNDEVGVIGAYFIDEFGSNESPRTEFVWNLDAFDLGLCGTDPVTLTHNVVPGSAFNITTNTITTAALTVTEEPMELVSTPRTAPATIPFCSLFVGVEEEGDGPQLLVYPTLVRAGTTITLRTTARLDVQVADALGRTVLHQASLAPGTAHTIATEGWARGLYLVRASNGSEGQRHTVKVMVE